MELSLVAIIFATLGALGGALYSRSSSQGQSAAVNEQLRQATGRLAYVEAENATLGQQAAELRERAAVLDTQLQHSQQQLHERNANEERLISEFDRLSRATLKETSEELVKVAESTFKLAQQTAKGEIDQQRFKIENLVKPVQENLSKLEAFIQKSEKERDEQYGGLFEQMQSVAATSKAVQAEAAQLKNVLRTSSSARGRWGEVQLRRVVELAGMSEFSDFAEQESSSLDERRSRADLVVYLPGDIKIPVDAKVPYGAYEQAQTCEDAIQQKAFFLEHAKQFRAHIDTLAKRCYWDQYLPTSGFAVLFVPGDALLDAALVHDAGLWEAAAEKQILLATPSTLIALLRMAAMGWRQEAQAENAAEIARVGKELLKRLTKANTDVEKMGKALKSAVGSYNDFVGSYESRVQPQARKLAKLSGGEVELRELADITEPPRKLRNSSEMLEIKGHSEAS